MDHVVVAALAVAFLDETTGGRLARFIHFRIQRGEEKVLKNGRVVTARLIRRVFEQFTDATRIEQRIGQQAFARLRVPLFSQKPAENQARDETNEMH